MPPLKVTFDTQCVNDLLERRDFSPALDKCLQLASEGRLEIGIPAICGSENLPGYLRPDSISLFLEKLRQIGLTEHSLLLPFAIWDVTFWDYAIWAGDADTDLEQKLWAILFPDSPRTPPATGTFDQNATDGNTIQKQINRKCDVLVAWTHIHYGRDVLLTRDRNFMKQSKLPQLLALGAGRVVSPSDFITGFA